MPNRHQSNEIKDTHILVLGGAGYLGSVLVRQLLKQKYTVTVYDSFLYDPASLEHLDAGDLLSVIRGDVRDREKLAGVIQGKDVVVNLAAIVGDAACDIDVEAAKAINVNANVEAFRLSHEHGVKRFIAASTCSVYGYSDDLLREDSFLNPLSLYAQTKLTSELLLFTLRRKLDTSMTILRFATLFGWSPRPRFDLAVNTMTSSAIANGAVTVFGGNQWRPHLHVKDVSEAIINVIEAPRETVDGEIFNVGGNGLNMTVTELGRLICGLVPGCRVEHKPDHIDPRNYLVDFGKIQSALGFQPRYDISDGVHEIVRHCTSAGVTDFDHPIYSNALSLRRHRDRVRSHLVPSAPAENLPVPAG